jgi:hypothetical protein
MMSIAMNGAMRLDAKKAQKVNTALDLLAQTARRELAWKQRQKQLIAIRYRKKSSGQMSGGNSFQSNSIMTVRRASRLSVKQYEAVDNGERWLLTVVNHSPEQKPVATLKHFDSSGKFLDQMSGIAALSGLAAVVETQARDAF